MRPNETHLSDAALVEKYAVPDRDRQYVRANFISSLDGAATQDGRAGGLGNADDQQLMGVLRALSDVVLLGAGTMRVEGYGSLGLREHHRAWRVAQSLPEYPTFAVVSGRLDLDPDSPAFTDARVRPLIFTHDRAPENRRRALSTVADVISCGADELDPRMMLAELAARGLNQVLCEGGPHLFSTLVEADGIDELCLTLSPVIENGPSLRITAGHPQAPFRMKLGHVLPVGDLLLLRYVRVGP